MLIPYRTAARRLCLTTLVAGASSVAPHLAAQSLSPLFVPQTPMISTSTLSSPFSVAPAPLTVASASTSDESLPDAPGFSSSSRVEQAAAPQQSAPPAEPSPIASRDRPSAGPFDKYVEPWQTAPHLTHFDKVMVSVKDTFSLFNLAGIVISASYSHVTNGSPNYGTNGKAYAQRLGAAAARDTSESVFRDAILANILHEDPRYYALGHNAKPVRRVWYAATRTIVTRTDGGRPTPNFALLGGFLGSSALTQVYYPPTNQGGRQLMITYGGALGGATLGFIVAEFSDDLLKAAHLKYHNY